MAPNFTTVDFNQETSIRFEAYTIIILGESIHTAYVTNYDYIDNFTCSLIIKQFAFEVSYLWPLGPFKSFGQDSQ